MEQWIGEAVGTMHLNKITQRELAEHLGYTREYVTMILNGIKKPKGAKETIMTAIREIVASR